LFPRTARERRGNVAWHRARKLPTFSSSELKRGVERGLAQRSRGGRQTSPPTRHVRYTCPPSSPVPLGNVRQPAAQQADAMPRKTPRKARAGCRGSKQRRGEATGTSARRLGHCWERVGGSVGTAPSYLYRSHDGRGVF
jgi:hypothetical protein